MTYALLFLVIFSALTLISFFKIRRDRGVLGFIYKWGFPLGSFVWEDLFVFSLYGAVAASATLISGQIKIGVLFLVIFWVVRSAGETLYFFLQQFIEPKHHPHDIEAHFRALRWVFGPLTSQQCYIIMQVLFQMILMLSLSSLILLLLSWPNL